MVRDAVRAVVNVERNGWRHPDHKGSLIDLPAMVPHDVGELFKKPIHLPICGPNVINSATPGYSPVGRCKSCDLACMQPSLQVIPVRVTHFQGDGYIGVP